MQTSITVEFLIKEETFECGTLRGAGLFIGQIRISREYYLPVGYKHKKILDITMDIDKSQLDSKISKFREYADQNVKSNIESLLLQAISI